MIFGQKFNEINHTYYDFNNFSSEDRSIDRSMKRLSFVGYSNSFIVLSFSRLLATSFFFFFFSEEVALNYNERQLGRTRSRSRRNGFSLSRTRLQSLSFRVIIAGNARPARGRDRYDRASGRETCSRVYIPASPSIQACAKPVIIASLDAAGLHSFAFSIPRIVLNASSMPCTRVGLMSRDLQVIVHHAAGDTGQPCV